MTPRLAIRRAVAISVLGGALLALAIPASAHAELVSSTPADGATVTSLTSVRLEFSEELLEIGNSITVTDSAGVSHELVVTRPEPTVLEAPVGVLGTGEVTIAWRNASVDGHTEEGELHVTLAPPSPSPSATSAAQPGSVATLTAIAATPTAIAPSAIAAVESGSGANPWLWALLGLVVIGGTAAAIIAATRRPPHEE